MKPLIAKEYNYTGEYYGYVIITSADGTVSERRYNVNPDIVKLSLAINLVGELLIESKFKMQINGYVKNITDKNGDEIYQGGEWQIVQTAPLLSGIGTKEGYKYRARLIAGDI